MNCAICSGAFAPAIHNQIYCSRRCCEKAKGSRRDYQRQYQQKRRREASRCQGKSSGRSEVKRFAWLCAGFAPALLWLSFGAAVALKRAFE